MESLSTFFGQVNVMSELKETIAYSPPSERFFSRFSSGSPPRPSGGQPSNAAAAGFCFSGMFGRSPTGAATAEAESGSNTLGASVLRTE